MADPQQAASGSPPRPALGRASTALSLAATGRFLRGQVWIRPIIVALVFGGFGWWVHHSVEGAMREQRAADLDAMVDASVTALRVWMTEQEVNVRLFADDERLLPPVRELLALADGGPTAARRLTQAPAQEALRGLLRRRLEMAGFVGFVIISPDGVVLAAGPDMAIGRAVTSDRREAFREAMAGRAAVTRPFRSGLPLPDEKGEPQVNLPTMFIAGPLGGGKGKPLAALGLRIRPEDQFTRILQANKFGRTGETYAFDENGLLLSQSRFDDQLKELGLLADQRGSSSVLTLELRDPGVNMALGERPKHRRSEQPLTALAAAAVRGEGGHDADGYRDYRGVPTVGAWRWLPEIGIGVGTEVDAEEAFRPVYILRKAFWALIAILGLLAVGILVAMLYIARQQKALQKATLAAKQLGRYTLQEKLGSGGMGTVYKARHAMLLRPAAVKLLDPDKMTESAAARFEREVQLTGALTHPNTVAVFDYGRTEEGIFYYAMEYLEGMNLDDLVRRFGPLNEARLAFILRQACGSLAEAHAAGLVHRDIKPANIFLTRRGGLHDFVKVLDFGLAKAMGREMANVTSPDAVMGTPLYIPPEAVNRPDAVDARSDVYAVAAVAYFLLTGTPVFVGGSVMEICMKHAREAPEPPSSRLGKAVTPALEALLMRCLSKEPGERPADAAALLRELESLAVAWTVHDAAAWWASVAATPAGQATEAPVTPAPEVTRAYQQG